MSSFYSRLEIYDKRYAIFGAMAAWSSAAAVVMTTAVFYMQSRRLEFSKIANVEISNEPNSNAVSFQEFVKNSANEDAFKAYLIYLSEYCKTHQNASGSRLMILSRESKSSLGTANFNQDTCSVAERLTSSGIKAFVLSDRIKGSVANTTPPQIRFLSITNREKQSQISMPIHLPLAH